MAFKIQNTNKSQSVPEEDKSKSNEKEQKITKIFRAKKSPAIDYSWKDLAKKGLVFSMKWFFFPITLPIGYAIKKLARSAGIADHHAREVDQNLVHELMHLGGDPILFRTYDKVKLEGMMFKNSASNRSGKTVLVCSGSHSSSEQYNLPIVQALLAMGHDVMTFNYRGFGNSKGSPSESGLYKDGEAAYQYLKSQGIDDDNLVLYGYSLGGAIAADVAARHTVNVVLDRAFSSGGDRAEKEVSGGMKWIARFVAFTGCNFDNKNKIKYIKGKIFIAQEYGSESFLARMRRALEKAHHQKMDTLEQSGEVTTVQLAIGHFHNVGNLWFGEEKEGVDEKEKFEKFLNLSPEKI